MEDRVRRAFEDVRADEALLQKTAAYLRTAPARREAKPGLLRPLLMAAAVLALVVGAFGYRSVYSAAAFVGIDVNPSVELTLNGLDRVISAEAYNEEGETLLRELALNGKRCEEAAASLLKAMEREGYLGGGALVTLTVQTEDGAKERALCDELLRLANERLGSAQSPAEVEVFPVERETRESARGCHMSAAKYLAIQELMEVDETATLDEYSGCSIRQIRQRAQACRQGEGHEEQAAGGGAGQGDGHHDGRRQGHSSGQGQGGGHGYRGGG